MTTTAATETAATTESASAAEADCAVAVEKHRYHHGNLREALLLAAFNHLNEQGAETLSLRALARSIGVSQSAPYRHFADKKSLLAAMAAQGIDEMFQHMLASIDDLEDPEQALLAGADGCIKYALANPEAYRLIFGPGSSEYRDYPDVEAARERLMGTLVQLFERGQSTGICPPTEPAWFLACNAWANVHGHIMLVLDNLISCAVPEGETFDLLKSVQINMYGKLISPRKSTTHS
ncbi:TetR/AcrR family transcriptional regulator [Endozoicomonadaceae bacterium StTr2]